MLDDSTIKAIVAKEPFEICQAIYFNQMKVVTGYDHEHFKTEYLFWSKWTGTDMQLAKKGRYTRHLA